MWATLSIRNITHVVIFMLSFCCSAQSIHMVGEAQHRNDKGELHSLPIEMKVLQYKKGTITQIKVENEVWTISDVGRWSVVVQNNMNLLRGLGVSPKDFYFNFLAWDSRTIGKERLRSRVCTVKEFFREDRKIKAWLFNGFPLKIEGDRDIEIKSIKKKDMMWIPAEVHFKGGGKTRVKFDEFFVGEFTWW
jgi:hypothetical protein